jgi:hypothetical protein
MWELGSFGHQVIQPLAFGDVEALLSKTLTSSSAQTDFVGVMHQQLPESALRSPRVPHTFAAAQLFLALSASPSLLLPFALLIAATTLL